MVSFDKWRDDDFDRFEIWVGSTRVLNEGHKTDDPNEYGCFLDGPWTDGWEEFPLDLTPYLGQNITLRFVNKLYPDRTYNTWTYVDDIQFLP